MDRFATPSQVSPPDLPSWTPLKTLEDDGSLVSDPELDELAVGNASISPIKQSLKPPNKTRPTVKVAVTARRTLNPSSDVKSSNVKRARFDGVFISKKPPPYYRRFPKSRAKPRPVAASNAHSFSLVDALARTFDANRHTEATFLPQGDNASTGPQTDVEINTEAEDEQLQLNTRLAPTTLKRDRGGRPRIYATVSETNSEDATSRQQDVLHPERPIKRLRLIQYEANSALVDAALGTVQAPISWDAEMDIITRDEDVVAAQAAHFVPASDVQMAIDGGGLANPSPPHSSAKNGSRTLAVLSPYLSRGAKFRERLHAAFGEDATVRTDRGVRPRPADLDFYVLLDEPESETSPSVSVSDSTASGVGFVSASTVEVVSAVPSTHITSQSPDIPSDTNVDPLPRERLTDGADSSTKSILDVQQEQTRGWIAALQRLVKGKVRVKEEDLDTLSIILAQIESVKGGLDQSASMTSELRESIKQLSELHEIPFGDRNKLRQRAANIFYGWPSMNKTGNS